MTDTTSKTRTRTDIPGCIQSLAKHFDGQVMTGQTIREQHAHTTSWLANQPPDAVFYPKTTNEVSEAVRICAQHGTPVIPYGAGSSLEGQVNAPHGGICFDLSNMNRILSVNDADLDCEIEPGVTRNQLNSYLRDKGLFFPIDPGADATLGGMASTRASGTNAVRYGTMKDSVISIEAVMADGEIIRTAQRARKSSAGYDLTRLLVGAEGTLGIITKLTLKLHGIPEAMVSATCSFPTVHDACETVIATIQMGIPIARIELLDETQIKAVNAYSNMSLPETPMLLLEFHGSEAGVREQAELFGELAEDNGAKNFEWTASPEERTKLWQARHDAYWAAMQIKPGHDGISTDVCVPISRLAECVGAVRTKLDEMKLVAPIVGHVGDGNFHTLLLVNPNDPEDLARAKDFIAWLTDLAIALDGTCTGEHGVGQGKKAYLAKELSKATPYMARIKRAFDPHGIMNPGKIFD